MKKLLLLSLFLGLLLALAVGASAESGCALGEAYLRLGDDGTVQTGVQVTADRPCTLYTALYDENGRFLGLKTQDVAAGALETSVSAALPAPQDADGIYARFFLTAPDRQTPLAEGTIAAASGVYAALYADGTLVFQCSNQADPERGAATVFPVAPEGYDVKYVSGTGYVSVSPWYAQRKGILRVDFADTIRPLSTKGWFLGCSDLNEIKNMHRLDTSAVTDMRLMFGGCRSLTSLDLSGFDTSAVTDMRTMFYGCSGLTALNLSNFDTSAVTNMSSMFSDCSGLTALDLSGFDTSAVTDMDHMFYYCSGLTALDLSSFDTSAVTDMNGMFYGCSGLTALDLSGFDTSAVTDMSWMFYGCSGLTALDLSGFDTSAVTDMRYMFDFCSNLTALNLSGFDTSAVTDMGVMFQSCRSLTALDLSNFDTSAVTDMGNMFYGCWNLTALDLSGFDTSAVTDMSGMFCDCSGLTALDLSGFVTSAVTDMRWMFDGCSALHTIYASDRFSTDAVTDSSGMFSECSSLVGGNGTAYDAAHTDKAYARIDRPGTPGYFTEKTV
ncbi:MAG: DUF285 domain-containing protein [Oscillospiraceae bacterium]|nr:DUF285 domain-containing protein [Oscillospiraceae bacterium]